MPKYLVTQRSELNTSIDTKIVKAASMVEAFEVVEGRGSYDSEKDVYDKSDIKIQVDCGFHVTQVEVLSNVTMKNSKPTLNEYQRDYNETEIEIDKIEERMETDRRRVVNLTERLELLDEKINELEMEGEE